MKRPVENQLQFPLLNVIYDPLAEHTVLVTMPLDWGKNGDVDIRYTSLQSLKDLAHILDFARNAIADEIFEAESIIKGAGMKKGDVPF